MHWDYISRPFSPKCLISLTTLAVIQLLREASVEPKARSEPGDVHDDHDVERWC